MTKRSIEFIASGHSAWVGSFAPGDRWDGDAAAAQQLVEAGAAKFRDVEVVQVAEAVVPPADSTGAMTTDPAAAPAAEATEAVAPHVVSDDNASSN